MPVAVATYDRLEDAARAAAERGSRFFGGGTILMRAVNHAAPGLERLVRTADPALFEIRAEGERVVLGAGVTMAAIAAHRELDFLAPVARVVGGPAVRTMATVGGNLFAEHPYGDLAAALLALGAEVRLADGDTLDVADFLARRDREPRPVVAAVALSRPPRGAFRFRKVSRVHPKGVSVMSISALVPTRGGRIAGARIAYGAMGPTPVRAAAAERSLEGRSLDAAGIEPALARATDGLEPPTDALASSWYRREVAPIHLARCLLGG